MFFNYTLTPNKIYKNKINKEVQYFKIYAELLHLLFWATFCFLCILESRVQLNDSRITSPFGLELGT